MNFVCPDCRQPLADDSCANCQVRFERRNGIPLLLPRAPRLGAAARIGAVYDDIYEHRTAVWEDQGRTADFIRYFAELVAAESRGELLEIGCGEGILLESLHAARKTAINLSATALERAEARTGATSAVALAESLPFADASFDVAVSVGVMEHFLDDAAACREIARVLRPGGSYVVLIHVALTRAQEALQKLREYVFPRPRPLRLARWLASKFYRPIHQPIMLRYTLESARDCLAHNGFTVARIIDRAREPSAPLVGPHVVIYVCRKR